MKLQRRLAALPTLVHRPRDLPRTAQSDDLGRGTLRRYPSEPRLSLHPCWNFHPLSWLFSNLGHSLWGMNPLGYHAASVALHMLNGVLFFLVTLRLLRLAAPDGDVALTVAAACAALFFALHPLRVESVAWLSGQHDLLASAFYLLAVLCSPRAGQRSA